MSTDQAVSDVTYEHTAKEMKDQNTIKTAVLMVASTLWIPAYMLDEEILRNYTFDNGQKISMNKWNDICKAVADIIMEFYGISPREMDNPDAIAFYKMLPEHVSFIQKYYPIGDSKARFLESKYSEEYKKVFPVNHNEKLQKNKVMVNSALVNQTLQWLIEQQKQKFQQRSEWQLETLPIQSKPLTGS